MFRMNAHQRTVFVTGYPAHEQKVATMDLACAARLLQDDALASALDAVVLVLRFDLEVVTVTIFVVVAAGDLLTFAADTVTVMVALPA